MEMFENNKISTYKISLIYNNFNLIINKMSDYYKNSELSIREIPKFQFQLHNEELVNCIKQLSFNMKNQQKNIQKIKKDIEARPTQSHLTEAFVFINSLIEIDPNISKQLKTKQSKKEDLANNPIKNSSSQLGKKINMISESITILNQNFKNLDKKVNDLQYSMKNSLAEKGNMLQEQIDSNYTKATNQITELKEKIELMTASFGDKVREVQTKTIWQINDCKLRLNSCVNEQFVKDGLKELDGKMTTKMKEQLIRQGSIDPERVSKIQQNALKIEKEFASQLTGTNYKIQNLKESIDKSLLSKKEFGEQKIEFEKRFNLLNNNIADSIRRIRQTQSQLGENKDKFKKFEDQNEFALKEINRMNSVLNNLKIGDDFQKMLEKMDPHKICQLDSRVDDLELNSQKLSKTIDLTKKDLDRLRSKTQFCNVLSPNTGTTSNAKLSKQELQSSIHEYLTNNLFHKKLQNLQSQFLEVKSFPEIVNNINKNIARMQKQTDTHNIIYELKGLQQYVKKQILIVNNRITNLEVLLNEEKRKRPLSAGRNQGDQKLSSSVSYKKLTPVSCISCYPSPGGNMDKKNLIRRL